MNIVASKPGRFYQEKSVNRQNTPKPSKFWARGDEGINAFYVYIFGTYAKHLSFQHLVSMERQALVKQNEAACNPCKSTNAERIHWAFAYRPFRFRIFGCCFREEPI